MSDIEDEPSVERPHWAAKQAEQQRGMAKDFQRVYANNVGLGLSNWDASLVFGEIVGERDGQPVIEEKVRVTVPLSMLKAMTMILSSNVAAFEKEFGEIVIPNIAAMKIEQTLSRALPDQPAPAKSDE